MKYSISLLQFKKLTLLKADNNWICSYTMLYSPCLLEFSEQSIICSQGKVKGPEFVVVRVGLEVLNDICKEMGPLNTTSWCFVAQHGEMDMEMVVRWLVVQVDSQLTGRKIVALHYDLLMQNETALFLYLIL